MQNRQIIVDIVKSTIEDFAENDYMKQPFVYVYEADIQSCLYYHIRKRLIKAGYFKTRKETLLYKFTKAQGTVEELTAYLHCQTAIPKQGKGRKKHLDIGIWADDGLANNAANHCNKPVCLGIEIKQYWERIVKDVIIESFIKDIRKLAQAHGDFVGIAICFLPRMEDLAEIKEAASRILGKMVNKSMTAYLITRDKIHVLKKAS